MKKTTTTTATSHKEEEQQQKHEESDQNNSEGTLRLEIEQYLLSLNELVTFSQLMQSHPKYKPQLLMSCLDKLKQEKKINYINLFIPFSSECSTVYIEYFMNTSISHPPIKQSVAVDQNTTTEKDHDVNHEDTQVKAKSLDEMDDEELHEMKKQLIAKKEQLEERKHYFTTKKDKIKKIQEFNSIKEAGCSVFQRIATINKLSTKEVCESFGVDIHSP